MKISLVLILLIYSLSVSAKDSRWKICKGDVVLFEENSKLLMNVYEHRSGAGRATELTLIYGGHTLTGTFDNSESDSGLINLKNTQSTFSGWITADTQSEVIELSGHLNVNASTPVEAKLNCELLAD